MIVAAREARTVKLEELLYLLVDVAVVYRHTKLVVLNICTLDQSSGLHEGLVNLMCKEIVYVIICIYK